MAGDSGPCTNHPFPSTFALTDAPRRDCPKLRAIVALCCVLLLLLARQHAAVGLTGNVGHLAVSVSTVPESGSVAAMPTIEPSPSNGTRKPTQINTAHSSLVSHCLPLATRVRDAALGMSKVNGPRYSVEMKIATSLFPLFEAWCEGQVTAGNGTIVPVSVDIGAHAGDDIPFWFSRFGALAPEDFAAFMTTGVSLTASARAMHREAAVVQRHQQAQAGRVPPDPLRATPTHSVGSAATSCFTQLDTHFVFAEPVEAHWSGLQRMSIAYQRAVGRTSERSDASARQDRRPRRVDAVTLVRGAIGPAHSHMSTSSLVVKEQQTFVDLAGAAWKHGGVHPSVEGHKKHTWHRGLPEVTTLYSLTEVLRGIAERRGRHLDDVVIPFMKIDTEGGDPTVLMASRDMFQRQRVAVVVFEVNAMVRWFPTAYKEAFAMLIASGYRLYFVGMPHRRAPYLIFVEWHNMVLAQWPVQLETVVAVSGPGAQSLERHRVTVQNVSQFFSLRLGVASSGAGPCTTAIYEVPCPICTLP